MNDFVNTFLKAHDVIQSCVTEIHLDGALCYIENYWNYFKDEDSYEFLLKKLNEKKNELQRE